MWFFSLGLHRNIAQMTRNIFLILRSVMISSIQSLCALCKIGIETFSGFNPLIITLWIMQCGSLILFRHRFCHTSFQFIWPIITVFGFIFGFYNAITIYWWLKVWVCVKWLCIRVIGFTSQCRILSKFLFAHVLILFCFFIGFFLENFDSYLIELIIFYFIFLSLLR